MLTTQNQALKYIIWIIGGQCFSNDIYKEDFIY